MAFALQAWPDLTRLGLPTFTVIRRPLLFAGTIFGVGAEFPIAGVTHTRLRQLYEQRAIAPSVAVQHPAAIEKSKPVRPPVSAKKGH